MNAPLAERGGRTILEEVAEYGRFDMVQFLLNAGEGQMKMVVVNVDESAQKTSSKHGQTQCPLPTYTVRELCKLTVASEEIHYLVLSRQEVKVINHIWTTQRLDTA